MNASTGDATLLLLIVALIGLLALCIGMVIVVRESRLMDKRLTKLETLVDVLPSQDDLEHLRNNINAMRSELATVNGRSQTMAELLRTIHKHLLEHDQ